MNETLISVHFSFFHSFQKNVSFSTFFRKELKRMHRSFGFHNSPKTQKKNAKERCVLNAKERGAQPCILTNKYTSKFGKSHCTRQMKKNDSAKMARSFCAFSKISVAIYFLQQQSSVVCGDFFQILRYIYWSKCRVGHRVLLRSERIVLLRSFFVFLASYETQKNDAFFYVLF